MTAQHTTPRDGELDTRDLETRLRQDLGLLEWQIRDLLPIIASIRHKDGEDYKNRLEDALAVLSHDLYIAKEAEVQSIFKKVLALPRVDEDTPYIAVNDIEKPIKSVLGQEVER